MTIIHPRRFETEYVLPAVEWWMRHQAELHLAIHAITQFDNLAEIVALWLAGDTGLERGGGGRIRQAQGLREPALAMIRDTHDSHKHGRLTRTENVFVSRGQRPQIEADAACFCGHTFCGGPLTPNEELRVTLDDGSQKPVYTLLHEAQQAWTRVACCRFGRHRPKLTRPAARTPSVHTC